MTDEQDRDFDQTSAGTLAATAMALVVLVGIIALFLVLKFNLFDGGKPPHLPTTAPAPRALTLTA